MIHFPTPDPLVFAIKYSNFVFSLLLVLLVWASAYFLSLRI